MKKTLSLLISASLLLACNSSTGDKTTTTKIEQDTSTSIVADEEHAHDVVGLTLNNGAKWNGDEPTNANVKNLETILSDFNPSTPATEDYVTLSNNLQAGLNKLIQDCRMKGPDHDALHAWLEPLIVKVKNLKAITDINTAKASTNDIKEHIELYHEYFK